MNGTHQLLQVLVFKELGDGQASPQVWVGGFLQNIWGFVRGALSGGFGPGHFSVSVQASSDLGAAGRHCLLPPVSLGCGDGSRCVHAGFWIRSPVGGIGLFPGPLEQQLQSPEHSENRTSSESIWCSTRAPEVGPRCSWSCVRDLGLPLPCARLSWGLSLPLLGVMAWGKGCAFPVYLFVEALAGPVSPASGS